METLCSYTRGLVSNSLEMHFLYKIFYNNVKFIFKMMRCDAWIFLLLPFTHYFFTNNGDEYILSLYYSLFVKVKISRNEWKLLCIHIHMCVQYLHAYTYRDCEKIEWVRECSRWVRVGVRIEILKHSNSKFFVGNIFFNFFYDFNKVWEKY